jgi:hypothetical protein
MRRCLALLLLALLAGTAQAQRSWTLGGERADASSLAALLKLAKDGDTINIMPGQYRGEVAAISHKQLTLRGIGPRPQILADGRNAEGKAIWVIRGGDITVENLEFRDARVRDRNGAGIRFERGNLRVLRCAFIDNESGLIASNNPDTTLVVEDSEFRNAVRVGPGLSHLLYVGTIKDLSVRGSRFHQVAEGHLLKSRARRSWLAYNLFVDGPAGTASYEVEFAKGGDATLVGNVIAQGKQTHNNVVVAYGAEGQQWPVNRLRLSHNTLVNERLIPAQFIKVWHERVPGAEVVVVNNLSVGMGALGLGVDGRFAGNLNRWRNVLVAPDLLDFALDGKAWAIGETVDTRGYGEDLKPDAEFNMPIGTRPLKAPESWVPGALQR